MILKIEMLWGDDRAQIENMLFNAAVMVEVEVEQRMSSLIESR